MHLFPLIRPSLIVLLLCPFFLLFLLFFLYFWFYEQGGASHPRPRLESYSHQAHPEYKVGLDLPKILAYPAGIYCIYQFLRYTVIYA